MNQVQVSHFPRR